MSSISSASSRTTRTRGRGSSVAALEVIDEPARACRRRRARPRRARAPRAAGPCPRRTTRPGRPPRREPRELALHLDRELARRRDDERARAPAPSPNAGSRAEQRLRDREAERDGLAGAGARGDEQVAAAELRIEHRRLDRRRRLVPPPVDARRSEGWAPMSAKFTAGFYPLGAPDAREIIRLSTACRARRACWRPEGSAADEGGRGSGRRGGRRSAAASRGRGTARRLHAPWGRPTRRADPPAARADPSARIAQTPPRTLRDGGERRPRTFHPIAWCPRAVILVRAVGGVDSGAGVTVHGPRGGPSRGGTWASSSCSRCSRRPRGR